MNLQMPRKELKAMKSLKEVKSTQKKIELLSRSKPKKNVLVSLLVQKTAKISHHPLL